MTYNEISAWFYADGKPNARTVDNMQPDDRLPWLIIRFFESRGGFDHWWDDVDDETQNEIFDGLRTLISEFRKAG